ncbi:MAG TPA: LPS export ABC transporter periplasmic protein LptC [Allosphingosinicella sp.]|nr:LPS export ABC transporter periplasmic protein LptC [Allosphingosinicella sp.]
MSDLMEQRRVAKRGWAAPGGPHDWLMRFLKIALPAGVGLLLAYLLLTPLSKEKEISFLLDKNKVDTARERLKTQKAEYRGLDDKGRPFSIQAAQAVQAKSSDPVVDIGGMAARIQLEDGPATITADKAKYNMDTQKVDVLGPILFTASDGYRLETRDVGIDMNKNTAVSGGGVEGRMRLGRFTAGGMSVDLPGRRIVLTGRPRLHIKQGAIR